MNRPEPSPLQRAAWRYGHWWSGLLAGMVIWSFLLTHVTLIIGIPIILMVLIAICWHMLVMVTVMEMLLLAAGEVVPDPQVLATKIGRWVAGNIRVSLLPTWTMLVLAPFALIGGMA